MNKRLYIFQMVGKIFAISIMLLCVLMNLYAKSTFWQAMNIALKTFGAVAFVWALVMYCIIVKIVSRIEKISTGKLIVAITANIFGFVALWFLGVNYHVFTFFIAIFAILYFPFGINKLDISLLGICKNADIQENSKYD